jgi:enediyne biosynthesis protein E4
MLIAMEGPTTKNEVYLQDANHQFTAVGASIGFQQDFGMKSYGMAIGDTDGDGDMDVYISTCRGGGNIRNNFYQNMLKETGSLSFTDIADSNGTQDMGNTYGTEFVDFDNDGRLDLYVTGAQNDASSLSNPTRIYRNLGSNQFTLATTFTAGTDLNGSKAIDYDNDGDLDLFFHDNLSGTSSVRLFRNDGNWTFTDVTTAQGITGTGAGGYDGVWGDIDRDGDLDLINPNNATLSGSPTPERVYINDASTNGNHWLYIKLKGPDWNTTGIGASLYATLNDGTPQQVTLRREANTNPDTFNQSDLPVHFGLGSSQLVNRLLVRWPDGTSQTLNTILGDQYITVTYNPGDYSGDNVVDSRDYLVWRKGLGSDYTADDYLVWRSRFGTQLSPSGGALEGGAVPEPTTLGLMLSAISLCFFRRRL